MKRILVTGSSGYISTSFQAYMKAFPEDYQVDAVSLRGSAWKEQDVSPYDAVVHTAGLAHIKETPDNAGRYYEINRDLAIAAAQKAEASGVKQFVFLSSMSVYGMQEGMITRQTVPAPVSNYGKSKLQGEQGVLSLQSEHFTVSILRPPMVYGPQCKGNYQTLVKLAQIAPIFPDYRNQRSMVSIERLCACIKEIIDRRSGGLFFPQEPDYICTSRMVQDIAAQQGRRVRLVRWLNPAVYLLKAFTSKGKKAFGSLYYEQETGK